MNVNLFACYECGAVIAAEGIDDHEFRRHEGWHRDQETKMTQLIQRLEAIERRFDRG